MIEVSDLKKSYGAIEALRGVNFSIAPGQIVGFLGPKGAGKATITKVLTGTGSVEVAATPAKPVKPAARKARSRAVAIAPQVQAAPAPRQSHSVTFIDGGVRTTKEFVLQ